VVPVREDSGLAPAVTAGLGTVALRCPASAAMQSLLAAAGRPLAAPSANSSGTISPTRAEHVLASLSGRISLILDGGPTERGLESTIVAVEDSGVRLLRPGPIGSEEIEAALSPPCKGGAGGGSAEGGRNSEPTTLADARTHPQPLPSREGRIDAPLPSREGRIDAPLPSTEGRIEAPGQLASHYAPSKPLRLDAEVADPDEWLIGFGPVEGDDSLSPSGDLTEAAARLFDSLHRADSQPRPRIAVAPVPGEGIGLAINDRLRRAAAPRGTD
jgi:L-threonylcarbamoyladenylate synthase